MYSQTNNLKLNYPWTEDMPGDMICMNMLALSTQQTESLFSPLYSAIEWNLHFALKVWFQEMTYKVLQVQGMLIMQNKFSKTGFTNIGIRGTLK